MNMEEESFPRGHGNKKTVSSEEKKSYKRQLDKEVLFKEDGGISSKKRRKVKQRNEKRSKKLDDAEDASPQKQFGRADETEQQVTEGIVEGLMPTTTTTTIPKFTKVTQETISAEMLLLGVVKEVHEYEIVVSLPNVMTGYVQITDVSATYTKLLEKLGDDTMGSAEDAQEIQNLQSMYAVGSQVICKVKSVGSTQRGRHRIQLTLDPQAIHALFSPSMFQPGMVIVGNVTSIEDHGYVVDVGVSGVNSFLGSSDALTFIKTHNQGQPLFIAQPIRCVIKDVKAYGRSLVLSANPAAVSKAIAKTSSHDSFASLLPGTKVKATVKHIQRDHIKVILLTSHTGCIDQLHFEDNSLASSEFQEKQMLPHIADKKVKNPMSVYSIGSKVTSRILDFNLMDRIATVSMKQSVLEQPFLGYHDIQPGVLVKGTLTSIVEKGLCVKISDHINGFVPGLHMADMTIHKPQSKFTVGELLELRVLCVNPNKRRLLLTHKKSLVHSTMPIITSYDQPGKDMILQGFIISIRHFGYLVRFYNDVTGLIPRKELCSGPEPVPDDSYYIGQVVKCRVIKTYPPEIKRIMLSLRLLVTEDRQIEDTDYQNPNVGQLTEVKVTKVRELGLEVMIQPEGTLAFLPKLHLSDFVENCGLMLSCYEKGDTITDAMHWSFSPTRNCAVLTRKPMLIQARQNKDLIHGFTELQSGTMVMGVVKRVMPYGVFIELPNNVVGLAPKAAMSDDFISSSNAFQAGQTLRARVIEVDLKKSRFLLSLKSSICHPKKGEGQSLMEQYFHERDIVTEKLAGKEDWKRLSETKIGSQVMVRITRRVHDHELGGMLCELPNQLSGYIADSHIGDQDAVEKSKAKACVLHVDLNAKMVELCLDPETINLVASDSKKKTPQKSKSKESGKARVVMVKDDFILVCVNSNGRLAYIPGRRHLNDIRTGDDLLTVGQTIKVIKQSVINNRVFTAQFVSKKKVSRSAFKAEDDAVAEKAVTKEKTTTKKTAGEIIEAHSLQLGQKVTAVVKTVLECQLNVRVNNAVSGRIHITETADKMVQNKFPLARFKEGMNVEAKVIGHREVKDHRYLPITHTNFTKLALDLTLRPSKLNDDNYNGEDETLEKQLKTYQAQQTINCVVQKYADSILWVSVTGLLQGKVYQLNLSKNVGVLEQPTKYFLAGSIRQAKVISVDQQHQLLELTFIGSGCTELTPGMVTNGRILKILSNIGLVIQLPHGYRGRVSLTDLRDHFTEDALKGYKEKQFIRCCILEVTSKENVALSMRPSAVSKHHDPAIDPDIRSVQDLSVGDIVKGYVKNFTKVGVFVSLSRKVQGRIKLKKLSVSYIKEPESFFPKGKLLTVKVLSIDESSKIELSSSSADTGADDPIPKALRIPRERRAKKRKRRDSHRDDSDSGLDEPETLSDSEVEVVQKPIEDEAVARLQVSSGFSWETGLKTVGKMSKKTLLGNKDDSSSDESDDEAVEQISLNQPPRKMSKKERQTEEKKEEELLYKTEHALMDAERTPDTAEDFDRLVLSSPDSSLVWVRYMAFYLHSAEIDKAIAVAERALKTISFREEQEKLNVWVALLNLENLYGTEESLLKVFERALQHCEPLKVFKNLVNIYSHTGKLEQAEQLYGSMVKRFNLNKEVWVSYGFFLMQNGRHEAAHKLMQRSFKSLTPKEHIDVIVKFAQMEFKFGEAERGKTMLENILSNYPKRTDIWSVYLDMMIKQADVQAIRHLFERVIHLTLSAKKMKFFFKRYLEFEKKCGTEADVVEVKRKAVEYVESKMVDDAEST